MTTTVQRLYGDDSGFPASRPVIQLPDITTGLLLEYDADTLGAIGSNVTTWASSAGSLGAAADLTVSSTSKPTVVAGPNGHKAVQATAASSQYLRTALFGSPIGLPLTQTIVVRSDATSTSSLISGHFTSSSAFAGLRRNSTGYDAGAGATGELVNGSSADTTGYHVVTIRHGASALLRVDTVEAAGVTGQAAPTLANMPRVTLFANSAVNSQFFGGSITFMRAWARALTNADIASLHATLGAKYALAA